MSNEMTKAITAIARSIAREKIDAKKRKAREQKTEKAFALRIGVMIIKWGKKQGIEKDALQKTVQERLLEGGPVCE